MESNLSEVIIPIEDYIHAGLYSRTAYAKAGTMIVGAPHKKGGFAFLMSGTIKQVDGLHEYEVSAPIIIQTNAGTQRVAYAVTDCMYSTVHASESSTTLEAEVEIFEGVSQITRIRNSYDKVLELRDMTEKEAQEEIQYLGCALEDTSCYEIRESVIHGLGCFALKEYEEGSPIATAEIKGQRLGTARYVNHSDNPNCVFVNYKDSKMLIATKFITSGTELFVNYNIGVLACHQQ